MADDVRHAPHLEVKTFRFRNGYAAQAIADIAVSIDELWDALLELEDFPDHVPAIDFASLDYIDDDTVACRLKGKIGVWKLGVNLDVKYKMKLTEKTRLELIEYDGGVFQDVYFLHEVTPQDDGKVRLASTFYFDMTGFGLLRVFKIFERFPWMAEMLNLAAAAMLVRSFQLRWPEQETP